MNLLAMEDDSVGYVFLTLVLDGGASDDPPGKEGAYGMMANMLTCGAGPRTRVAFQEELDRLGADISVRTSRRYTYVEAEGLSRHFGALLSLLAEMLNSPHFPEDELEIQRNLAQAELAQIVDSDEELVSFLHGQFLWEGHPYGRSNRGDEASLAALTVDDIRNAFEGCKRRGIALIGASGAFSTADLKQWVEQLGLPLNGQLDRGLETALDAEKWEGIEVLIVDRRDRTQAQILWGQPSCHALHPDLYALRVANTAFGGTFTSTLMQEIREKRGWTYGAQSSLAADRTTGIFTMGYHVENENAVAAIELGLELYQNWRENGLDEQGIRKAKDYIVNSFPFSIETGQKRLEREISAKMLGRSSAYYDEYVENILAVTGEEIRTALHTHLNGSKLRLTVLGNAAELEPLLSRKPWVKSIRTRPYRDKVGVTL